ncbi:MAG: hypothetical protein COB08_007715 [Rhodobacteraceae bacterium]|nr:hypothetical protein [Paracoccaceae bacterium]
MGRKTTTRMLGCAEYDAKWIDDSMAVRLTARGFLPCTNHLAQLEKRVDDGVELVFYTQDSREEAHTPFCLQAILMVEGDSNVVLVVDALGTQEVAIRPAENMTPEEDTGAHIVYARKTVVNVPDETYFTLPVGTKVLPIYSRAFGPSSKAECTAFIASANNDFMMELDELHAKIERVDGREE